MTVCDRRPALFSLHLVLRHHLTVLLQSAIFSVSLDLWYLFLFLDLSSRKKERATDSSIGWRRNFIVYRPHCSLSCCQKDEVDENEMVLSYCKQVIDEKRERNFSRKI